MTQLVRLPHQFSGNHCCLFCSIFSGLHPTHILWIQAIHFKIALSSQKKRYKNRDMKRKGNTKKYQRRSKAIYKKLVPVCCSAGCTGVGWPSDRTRAAVRTADGYRQVRHASCSRRVCGQQLCVLLTTGWLDPDLGLGTCLYWSLGWSTSHLFNPSKHADIIVALSKPELRCAS